MRTAAEAAEREAHITAAAVEAGLPAPKIWETLTVNGRPGIVMERVEGPTMMRWGTTFPWRIYTGAKMMARLHVEVHSKIGADIPDLRDRLRGRIEENEVVEDDLKSAGAGAAGDRCRTGIRSATATFTRTI